MRGRCDVERIGSLSVRGLMLAALALPLSACMGSSPPPPSTPDVVQAVTATVENDSVRYAAPAASAATAATPPLRVTQVDNLGCNLAPDWRGFLCETVIHTTAASGAKRTMTRLVRMVETAGHWHATME